MLRLRAKCCNKESRELTYHPGAFKLQERFGDGTEARQCAACGNTISPPAFLLEGPPPVSGKPRAKPRHSQAAGIFFRVIDWLSQSPTITRPEAGTYNGNLD